MSNVKVETINRQCKLYRVGSQVGEGLWYDRDGNPTGLVLKHGIQAAVLPMGRHPVFSDGGSRWISVTDSREALTKWFNSDELERIAPIGYRVECITASAHRLLTFTDYGYAHQAYRVEDLISIEYLEVGALYGEAA